MDANVAIFKEYSSGYKKDGHYIHISIPGNSHPIPLQTPDEIADFYKSAGYAAGDQVPDQLVWELYDLNLHWTGGGGTSQVDTAGGKGGSPPELADAEIDRIREYVDSYTGEYAADLHQLLGRLKQHTQDKSYFESNKSEIMNSTPSVDFDVVDDSFSDWFKQRIQRWLPGRVIDQKYITAAKDHYPDHYNIKSPIEYLTELSEVPQYERLFDLYESHPWTIDSIMIKQNSIVDTTENPKLPILTARVDEQRSPIKESGWVNVQDLRPYQTQSDFELAFYGGNLERVSVAVIDGDISDFGVTPVSGKSTRLDSDDISNFVAESTDDSFKSVTHSLVISFVNFLPELLGYCKSIQQYDMNSTSPQDIHYQISK